MAPPPPRAPALSPRRRWIFNGIILLLVLGVAELLTTAFYRGRLGAWETMRLRLAGDFLAPFQKCEGQPYLLYIPTPGATVAGAADHNEQGYRGKSVPMRRLPGVARVLCLGGSTTYGWGVAHAALSYPARLEELLRNSKPSGVSGLEVLNGGLPYGTTAELFAHYHYKFHYFRPDLVVINVGGNDADGMTRPYYQPDYSHWRRTPCAVAALPLATRWLMSSRFASLVLIALVFGSAPEPMDILVRPPDEPPPALWYPEARRSAGDWARIPPDELAFRHNLESLVRAILADGGKVLLVPFRPAPASQLPADLLAAIAYNETIVAALAAELHVPLAPFPAATISAGNWVDYAHLNAAGEEEKAAYLAPFAREMLWGDPK